MKKSNTTQKNSSITNEETAENSFYRALEYYTDKVSLIEDRNVSKALHMKADRDSYLIKKRFE